MKETAPVLKRVFKSNWFAKAAKKARIKDFELCDAIHQVMLGQAIDLGGGVFKKRLNIPKILQNANFGLLLFSLEVCLKTRNRAGYYSLLNKPQA